MRAIVALFLYTGLNLSLLAQGIEIKAYVSKNSVTLDENFTYTIEISGKSTSLPDPVSPDMSKFYVLAGPSTSTSIQWINGKLSASKQITFVLRARDVGKITIEPARVTYEGKTYQSQPVEITVTRQKAEPQASEQKKAPTQRKDREIMGQDLYLKTEVSKTNPYVGEQIIVEYKLYFRVNVRGFDFEKLPNYPGFWTEEFKMPSRPVIKNEIVNGLNYNVATLRKVALFPTQSGQLELQPISIIVEAQVPRRSRSFFDSFFDDPFGRLVQKTVSSKPVKIRVRDLPIQGRPADFSGAVGNFTMSLDMDKHEVQTNEAVSLKLNIQGTGNIKMVDIPQVIIPPDIEKYDPKINTRIDNTGSLIGGRKTAEIILIPRIPGEFEIKPVRFNFFNPKMQRYQTLTSKPIVLKVSGEAQSLANVDQMGLGGVDQRYIQLLGRDIRYIKEYTHLRPLHFRPYYSMSYWGLLLAGLLVFVVFVLYNDYQARLSSDQRLLRSRKAGKIASKQLSKARQAMSTDDPAMFYKAVGNALQLFVRDKLNLDLTDFSTLNIRKHLQQRGMEQKLIEDYLNLLQDTDMRQFARIADTPEERKQFYERAREVLTRLEKWI